MRVMERIESWLMPGLPSRVDEEAEACMRSFRFFAERAWNNAEEGTPLIMEPVHQVICDHVQELVHGFVRMKFFQFTQAQSFGVLPRVSSARMPMDKGARDTETRSRARLAFLWALGQRMGVLLKSGRAIEKPQLFNNLLVSAGTGLGKSRFISVLAPSYLWLLWPWADVQAFSVNPDAVGRDAGIQLRMLRTPWWRDTFRLWWGVDEDKHAESSYRNTVGAKRMAAGWSKLTVGDRSHLQIIDDPESPKKVFSEGERASTRTHWDSNIIRRVHLGGLSIRLGTQARLHQEDWSSHVLKSGEWEHLELPTVAESTPSPCQCPTHRRGHTILGWADTRAPGETIAPRFLTDKEIASRRAAPIFFAAQDQQRPMGLAGNIFPREGWRFWRFADEDPVEALADRTIVLPSKEQWAEYFEESVMAADFSFGGKGQGSRDCVAIWVRRGARRMLIDLRWEAMSFVESRAAVRELSDLYPWVGAKIMEDAANGGAIINSLSEGLEIAGEDPDVPAYVEAPIEGIIAVRATGSKEYRGISIQHLHAAGNLFIPLHHPRRDEMLAEAAAFPRKGPGIRNDWVDTISHAMRHMQASAASSTKTLYEPWPTS